MPNHIVTCTIAAHALLLCRRRLPLLPQETALSPPRKATASPSSTLQTGNPSGWTLWLTLAMEVTLHTRSPTASLHRASCAASQRACPTPMVRTLSPHIVDRPSVPPSCLTLLNHITSWISKPTLMLHVCMHFKCTLKIGRLYLRPLLPLEHRAFFQLVFNLTFSLASSRSMYLLNLCKQPHHSDVSFDNLLEDEARWQISLSCSASVARSGEWHRCWMS